MRFCKGFGRDPVITAALKDHQAEKTVFPTSKYPIFKCNFAVRTSLSFFKSFPLGNSPLTLATNCCYSQLLLICDIIVK